MNISELYDNLLNVANVENTERRALIADLAIKELWYQIDIPGSLKQMYVALSADAPVVTLPPEVHILRAVRKAVCGDGVRMHTAFPFYQRPRYDAAPLSVDILGTTPLMAEIANATRLTFDFQEAQAAEIILTIQGRTARASSAHEELILGIGETSVTTVGAYWDVSYLSKSNETSADVHVRTGDSVAVGRMLNNLRESPCICLRLGDPCKTSRAENCLDILYRGYPPPVTAIGAAFPAPFDTTLLYKSLELAESLKTLDVAQLAEKARLQFQATARALNSGVTKRARIENHFHAFGSYGNL